MAGSILKKLKNDLQKNDLLRHQGGKKAKNGQNRDRKERDRRVLESIREAFNPFDVKKNREKHHTLGQNVTGQQGKPGISKQVGEEQRRQTYEAQKRVKNRVGAVVDRRFGENDKNMSSEDIMVERYARERMARISKASKFNLEDDGDNEVLTHYGQALSLADDFAEDDLGVDEDDDLNTSNKKRKLDGNLAEEQPEEPHKKSKHEVMQEIIQKSKLHKAARQQAQAQQEDIVDELNEQDAFDSLMADLRDFESSNKPKKPEVVNEVNAAYDQAVREMAFDRRAQPGDRTKTEEELRKEEEEKRANFEKMRQQRMDGEGDDLDFNDAENDAELFGLQLNDEAESESEIEFSDSEESAEKASAKEVSGTKCPQTFKELKLALSKGGDEVALVKKIIKLNDPAKAVGNKEKIEKLTTALCKYACHAKETHLFQGFAQILHELAPKYDKAMGAYFRKAISDVHEKIENDKPVNGPDMLMFALVAVIFSTSDQWHLVSNGATLVLTQHLSKTMAMDVQSLAVDLFFCDLLLTYQRLSKRYIPEVPALLLRALSAVSGVDPASTYVRVRKTQTVKLSDKFSSCKPEPLQLTQLRRLSADQLIVQLAGVVDRAAKLWRGLEAYSEVFRPLQERLAQLPENKTVSDVASRLGKTITFAEQEKTPLQLQEIRPMAIVTQAPLFEDNFNPEVKSYSVNPEIREAQKLRAMLKKERKQTLKEIRRDAEFLGREKLKESRSSMDDYHKMLASLTNKINSEEGAERNRYEREKRKRRR